MCHRQLEYLKETQYEQFSVVNSDFVQNLHYQNTEAPFIHFRQKSKSEDTIELTFENDPAWKWFKDDYVDKLESNKKWYPILDLIINCKGSSKPNKQWVDQINAAINKFGKERYFKNWDRSFLIH